MTELSCKINGIDNCFIKLINKGWYLISILGNIILINIDDMNIDYSDLRKSLGRKSKKYNVTVDVNQFNMLKPIKFNYTFKCSCEKVFSLCFYDIKYYEFKNDDVNFNIYVDTDYFVNVDESLEINFPNIFSNDIIDKLDINVINQINIINNFIK